MTLKEAIDIRHSRRSYTPKTLSGQAIEALTDIITQANTTENLHIQLITGGEKAFFSLLKTYGLFSGVHTYLAMVGPAGDTRAQELLGYYGELLVLTAQTFGLSSCWVGATFDHGNARAQVGPGEKLYCLITLGYARENTSLGERLAISMKGRPHTAEQIMTCRWGGTHHSEDTGDRYGSDKTHRGEDTGDDDWQAGDRHGSGKTDRSEAPRWFLDGIDAVLKAPSARNRLPVHFTLDQGIVTASCIPNGGYEYIDLGIARLHFEIGADYLFYDLRTGQK